MDLIPPLGVYAAMLREQGRDLDYPGGAPRVGQAVDVDLLARAIAWCGEADAARNEAFNVTNGDVFTWENIWPAVADALGMKPGKAVPLSMEKEVRKWIAPWDELRRKHDLVSPALAEFVGLSFQYADYSMRYGQVQPGPPSIVSTVKINQAGFTEMMDTEAMFRKVVRAGQGEQMLPCVCTTTVRSFAPPLRGEGGSAPAVQIEDCTPHRIALHHPTSPASGAR